MIRYAVETITKDTWSEALPIIRQAFNELELGRDGIEDFNPDCVAYERMQSAGLMHCYTARDDGNLVGYCIVFVTKSYQHKGLTIAHGDTYFVLPERRFSLIGLRLLRFVLKDIDQRGIKLTRMMTSERCDTGPLLRYLGFRETGKIYTRCSHA